jgi:hypothetical protein
MIYSLGFISMLLSLVRIRQLYSRQLRFLRASNQRLLRQTDLVRDYDTNVLFQGHQLQPEQVLNNENLSRSVATADTAASEKLSPIERNLRKTERSVFLEKKKLRHLGLERTAIRSELVFALVELIWPRRDHSRLEGYTGIIASICSISRLIGESRWQL